MAPERIEFWSDRAFRLHERRLFVRDGHPARRLLNLLVEACDGNGGETSAEQALLAQVQAAVDDVGNMMRAAAHTLDVHLEAQGVVVEDLPVSGGALTRARSRS